MKPSPGTPGIGCVARDGVTCAVSFFSRLRSYSTTLRKAGNLMTTLRELSSSLRCGNESLRRDCS